jgi:DNA helicase-2/ATP-dependent DNA helicase PcrA
MQRLIAHGKKILPLYYDSQVKTWRKEAKVEYRLSKVTWRGVPLVGVIDKMEDGMYENLKYVTDFKTSKPANAKPVSPDEKNPLGNDYWRQLAFYKLLIENYNNLDWFMEQGTIDCVEPNAAGEFEQFSLRIGLADFEAFKKVVYEAWQRIQAHDFFTGCGKTDCSWCRFNRKTQTTADSWHDNLDAEMDD